MRIVDIGEAESNLLKLVDLAAKGEPFIIAKDGKLLVKVVSINLSASPRRLGFMAGEIDVPDDFDQMGTDEIGKLFYGR